MALHKKWLDVNLQASWRDVITALELCHEDEVAETVKHQIIQSSGNTDNNMQVAISDETGNKATIREQQLYIHHACTY